ncbi:MAG: DNA alkylation repair protein, partial [Bacteroidales bacterium]
MQETDPLVNEVMARLESMGNPSRRAKSTTYCPTAMRMNGVSNPDLYGLVRELRMEHAEWSERQWIGFCMELVQTGVFECRGMAYELIGRNRRLLEALTRPDLSILENGLDNWASVDHFAVGIYGVLWRKGTVRDKDIELLLTSVDPWRRRIAVVSTIPL